MKLLSNILLLIIIFSYDAILGNIKAIIVEMDDILFASNENPGWLVEKFVDAQQYRRKFFEIISKIKDYDNKIDVCPIYKGEKIPKAWCYYLLDEIDRETILKKSLKAIHANTSSWWPIERTALTKIAEIAFGIEAQAELMEPIYPMYKILQKCSLSKQVILFSNKNIELIDYLIKKYPKIFSIFGANNKRRFLTKENIFISGISKKLKPDRNAYIQIIKHYKLRPEECLVIESQHEYLKVAKSLKMNGILYKHNNLSDIENALKHFNIIN